MHTLTRKNGVTVFEELFDVFEKPNAFEYSNSPELWNDPHISKQMLKFHLDPKVDPASRKKEFLDKSIQWIIQKFDIDSKSKLLDLGCGPGLYTFEFARTGANVTGIDVSENSIAYASQTARDANLAIDYINGNYVTCDFRKKYDLITLIYDDYCVLKPKDRKILLQKIHAALEDGGAFLVDVLSIKHFDIIQEKRTCAYLKSGGFWSPNEHFVFESTHKYEREKVFLERSTVIERNRNFTIFNYLKCFELDEIMQELSAQGLQTVSYYADVAGAKYFPDSTQIALVNIKKQNP
jgi:cyclopropane fatty-acyl-phospholipid synthase-like methyltransferase